MTDSRPIFIFISAKNCGTCKSYLPQWPAAKSKISQIARVIEIELAKTSDQLPNNYPPGLKRFKQWFPMFLMVPASQWYKGDGKPEYFNAVVFNGVDDGKDVKHSAVLDYPGIPDWAKAQLSTDLFKTPNVQPVTNSIKVPEVCGLVLNRYY